MIIRPPSFLYHSFIGLHQAFIKPFTGIMNDQACLDVDGGWGKFERVDSEDGCFTIERECNNPKQCGDGAYCDGEERDFSSGTCPSEYFT